MNSETAIKAPKVAKEQEDGKKEENADDDTADKKEEASDDKGIEDTRLFVMNLSYKVTHDELRDQFEKFG